MTHGLLSFLSTCAVNARFCVFVLRDPPNAAEISFTLLLGTLALLYTESLFLFR
jgi:hypothetical protein